MVHPGDDQTAGIALDKQEPSRRAIARSWARWADKMAAMTYVGMEQRKVLPEDAKMVVSDPQKYLDNMEALANFLHLVADGALGRQDETSADTAV